MSESRNQDGFRSIDYFNGYPVADMSDEQIFDYIGKLQDKLKGLEKVPAGAATEAHKTRLQADIDKLMAAVDGRYPTT